MVKIGQNRARRPGGIRPACPMHAVRLCGTAPGKKATGGAFCRREKRRPEREARAAGGLFALQPVALPAAWCAPVPPPALYGHTLCAPVLLSPACAPVLPPVLLTRRLPCVGISPERPHRGRPARPAASRSARRVVCTCAAACLVWAYSLRAGAVEPGLRPCAAACASYPAAALYRHIP